MDQYNNNQIENVDYVYFQNTISSEENIKNLSVVFVLLSFQKITCLALYEIEKQIWPNLWQFQQDKWYYFALVLGVCSFLASHISKISDKPLSLGVVGCVAFFITASEAYLVHFWLAFLPDSIEVSYWIYQIGVLVVFAVYFDRYCNRIEFKTISKIQLFFIALLSIVLIIMNYSQLYFILALAFFFNIIAYVHSYKTISFLFVTTHGWSNKNFLRTSFDLYIDNQVLFPFALIDTAHFVVEAIGYE